MNGRLVDTNVLIYLSKRSLDLNKVTSRNIKLSISVITYMEALGYQFENRNEKKIMEQLCDKLDVIQLNQEIVDKVIAIKKQRRIKLPDAIIIATAIISKLDLVTANVDDFKNIDTNLIVINPLI